MTSRAPGEHAPHVAPSRSAADRVEGRPLLRSGDALVVVDERGRVVQWNAAAESLTGIPPSAALGRMCWDIVGGRTEDGTPICMPGCRFAERRELERVELVINTARCKRRVSMSTIAHATTAGMRIIHLLSPDDAPEVVPLDVLTTREREVLALLSDGLDARALALRLGISVTTVRTHVRNVLSKLGVSSQVAAVAQARRGPGPAS